jgi:hypothetical protein
MLERSENAGVVVRRDERFGIGHDNLGSCPKRAAELGDHLVGRVERDVHDRPEIHREAEFGDPFRHAGVERPRLRRGLRNGHLAGPRHLGEADIGGQPLHSSPLLVDGDEGRQSSGRRRQERRVHRPDPGEADNVGLEVHDPADLAARDLLAQPDDGTVVGVVALEAHDDHLTGHLFDGLRRGRLGDHHGSSDGSEVTVQTDHPVGVVESPSYLPRQCGEIGCCRPRDAPL